MKKFLLLFCVLVGLSVWGFLGCKSAAPSAPATSTATPTMDLTLVAALTATMEAVAAQATQTSVAVATQDALVHGMETAVALVATQTAEIAATQTAVVVGTQTAVAEAFATQTAVVAGTQTAVVAGTQTAVAAVIQTQTAVVAGTQTAVAGAFATQTEVIAATQTAVAIGPTIATYTFTGNQQGWSSSNCNGFVLGAITAFAYDATVGSSALGSIKTTCQFYYGVFPTMEVGVNLTGITAPATGKNCIMAFKIRTSPALPAGYSMRMTMNTNGGCDIMDYSGSPVFNPTGSTAWTLYTQSNGTVYSSLNYFGIQITMNSGDDWAGTIWIDDVSLRWY
jgi:hypothetical protein